MYQGMMVWLHGIRPTGSVIQDGDHFLKQTTQKGLFLQIVSQQPLVSSTQHLPPEVQALLEDFAAVFEEPKAYHHVEDMSTRLFSSQELN